MAPKPAVKVTELLHTVISARSKPWSWLVPAAVVIAAAAAFLGGVFGAQAKDKEDAAWLGGAAICAVILAGYPFAKAWAQKIDEKIDLDEGTRLRVLLRDGLQPLAQQIAQMPALTPLERTRRLDVIANEAVWVFKLLMPGVEGLRAVVYELNDDGTELRPIAKAGRGGRHPRPFQAGTARGDFALELVTQPRPTVFEEDLTTNRPERYAGSGEDYATFISTSVHDRENAYGMLTIDAPNAGDLAKVDERLVEVVAGLMAIAFATAKAARPAR